MERQPVESSDIISIGWDPGGQGHLGDLEVEFSNGVYVYHDVPLSVYEGLMSAPSKGKFLAQSIKNEYVWDRV